MQVTLYTRPGCHLCEEAKKVLVPLVHKLGLQWTEVDVDTNPTLQREFGGEVPVVFLNGRKIAKHRIDPREFRRVVERHLRQERAR